MKRINIALFKIDYISLGKRTGKQNNLSKNVRGGENYSLDFDPCYP